MKVRQILGIIIISAVLFGLVYEMIESIGIVQSLIVIGVAIAICALIALGVWLLFGGDDDG